MPTSLLPDPVYVCGIGAATAVGRDAWSTAAAVRAGVSGFAEHPYMIDSAGEPMKVAIAPWLDVACEGAGRYEALLMPAVGQALAPLVARPDSGVRPALALGIPSPRPGLPIDLEAALRAAIGKRFPGRFSAVAVFAVGHAAGFLAMHAACNKIAEEAFDACIVAGVESYLAPETLEWLEERDQLHGAGFLNNAWGFIPGEGAGACLLIGQHTARRLGGDVYAGVLRVGRGFERNQINTETVCIGEGLTAALREAVSGLPPGARVTDVFCDMNGEPYRADEFGFACLRTKEAFVSASDFVSPADCWGDVSAASGPLCVGLSAIAARKTYANGEYSLLWASSEGGERGAALLRVPLSRQME